MCIILITNGSKLLNVYRKNPILTRYGEGCVKSMYRVGGARSKRLRTVLLVCDAFFGLIFPVIFLPASIITATLITVFLREDGPVQLERLLDFIHFFTAVLTMTIIIRTGSFPLSD